MAVIRTSYAVFLLKRSRQDCWYYAMCQATIYLEFFFDGSPDEIRDQEEVPGFKGCWGAAYLGFRFRV